MKNDFFKKLKNVIDKLFEFGKKIYNQINKKNINALYDRMCLLVQKIKNWINNKKKK